MVAARIALDIILEINIACEWFESPLTVLPWCLATTEVQFSTWLCLRQFWKRNICHVDTTGFGNASRPV
jgi:hypothetical protein